MKNGKTSARPTEIIIEDSLAGERLDRALAALAPELGLRGRRRLIEGGRVHVEGRPAPAGLKLRAGQRLTLLPETSSVGGALDGATAAEGAQSSVERADPPLVPVIARTPGYAALNKPAGLHSAALAGGGGASVEAMALTPRATHVLQWQIQRAAKPRGQANLRKSVSVRIAVCNSTA